MDLALQILHGAPLRDGDSQPLTVTKACAAESVWAIQQGVRCSWLFHCGLFELGLNIVGIALYAGRIPAEGRLREQEAGAQEEEEEGAGKSGAFTSGDA